MADPRFKNFVEPSWSSPIDGAAALRAVPETATISGMFLEPLAELGRHRKQPLPSARERYTPFRFYPLREHVTLLLETCGRQYPAMPLRMALRKLGRSAPKALISSTIGRVMLNSATGVVALIEALAKTYPLNLRPGRVEFVEAGKNFSIVRLEDIHYFLDSHHVGAFEGLLQFAGKQGSVRISPYSPTCADFLCSWED